MHYIRGQDGSRAMEEMRVKEGEKEEVQSYWECYKIEKGEIGQSWSSSD